MRYELPPLSPNPVIDAYKPGIDMTLVRENLKLTPNQRAQQLLEMQRLNAEIGSAGKQVFRRANVRESE